MKPPRKLLAIIGVVGIVLALKRRRSPGETGESTPETA